MKLFRKIHVKLVAVIIAMISALPTFAQIEVNGLVLDQNHDPVIGATVIVKGTSTGTATDISGRFSIKAPSAQSILTITYVGYQTAEIPANSPELKSGIILKENTEVLDEVVVIGYGSVKKSDATGSVTAIKPDEFNKGNRTSVQEAMVGKIAGVNIVASSGAPGSGADRKSVV